MLTDQSTWPGFWFLNGGNIHSLWKRRKYSEIKEEAFRLPRAAWDQQQKKIDRIESQLNEAHEFILKTSGQSQEKRYADDPDYWHDLGWEKDLEEYTKKYAR